MSWEEQTGEARTYLIEKRAEESLLGTKLRPVDLGILEKSLFSTPTCRFVICVVEIYRTGYIGVTNLTIAYDERNVASF